MIFHIEKLKFWKKIFLLRYKIDLFDYFINSNNFNSD